MSKRSPATPYSATPSRFPSRSHHGARFEEGGFSLLEVMIALAILALVIAFTASDAVSSAWGTSQSQAREVGSQIAASTLQEAQALGASAVGEGLACGTVAADGACSALAQSDPNHHLSFDSANGCWYYGSPSAGLLVPTTTETSTSDTPIIPYVTAPSTSYPPKTVNGVTYTVATYPTLDLARYAPGASVSCDANDVNGVGHIPVTVMTSVTWGAGQSQNLSAQTVLYTAPQPIASAGDCPPATPQSGSHLESLLANPTPDGTSVVPGENVSIIFLDEQPTPYAPSVCVIDTNGNIEQVPWSQVSQSPTYYGTSASNPYLNNIQAVHASFAASGPNAASPPKGGTYCSNWSSDPTSCNVEEQYNFTVPELAPSGLGITSVTIDAYDHEGDLDYYTWNVS